MNILDDRLADPMQTVFARLSLEDLVHLSQTNSHMRNAINTFLQELPLIQKNWAIQQYSSLGSSLIASLRLHPDGQCLTDIALPVLGGKQVDSENQSSDQIIITENKEKIAIDPIGQAVRIARQSENNYKSFWAVLRKSTPQLPELTDVRAIRAWLIDPKNSQTLANIESLRIDDSRFTFFPPEAKPLMTGLRKLVFESGCRSLQSLDLQGLTALRKLTFFYCHSLQSLNLQGLTNLEELNISYCHSLQNLNLQGLTALKNLLCLTCNSLKSIDLQALPALVMLNCSECRSLQSLNLQGLSALQHLLFVGCRSLQNLNPQEWATLVSLDCSECHSLQSLNLQGLTALKGLRCADCNSLQSLNLQGLTALEDLDCSGCPSLPKPDLRELTSLEWTKY